MLNLNQLIEEVTDILNGKNKDEIRQILFRYFGACEGIQGLAKLELARHKRAIFDSVCKRYMKDDATPEDDYKFLEQYWHPYCEAWKALDKFLVSYQPQIEYTPNQTDKLVGGIEKAILELREAATNSVVDSSITLELSKIANELDIVLEL